MGRGGLTNGNSPPSSPSLTSIDSSSYPPAAAASLSSSLSSPLCLSSICRNTTSTKEDLSTDLKLGLSISSPRPPPPPPSSSSSSSLHDFSSASNLRVMQLQPLDWPPIKSSLRARISTFEQKVQNGNHQRPSLFIKVYMEGIPIGRKLNLMAHHSYEGLTRALSYMFRTIILCPDSRPIHSGSYHVLTYEDREGDWMMVGDVPWEMFLNSVKRLKITRADRC